MTLKAFHLLFIAASILLAFGFGLWCLTTADLAGNHPAQWGGGGVSFAAAAGLLWYGARFLNKLKQWKTS